MWSSDIACGALALRAVEVMAAVFRTVYEFCAEHTLWVDQTVHGCECAVVLLQPGLSIMRLMALTALGCSTAEHRRRRALDCSHESCSKAMLHCHVCKQPLAREESDFDAADR